MLKKLWMLLLAVMLVFGLVFVVGCGGGSDDPNDLDDPDNPAKTGWTNDLGTPTLSLTDNFQYGDGYQLYFAEKALFNGKKIEKDDEYTLKITFKADRDLEGLILAGLVDRNPTGYNTKPNGSKSDYHTVLSYTQGDDPTDGAKDAAYILASDAKDVEDGAAIIGPDATTIIKANEEITVEVKFTALKSSSGTNADYNTICFQTRGVGTKGTSGSGSKGTVKLVCTQFLWIKGDGGESVTPPPEEEKLPEGAIALPAARYQKGDGDEDGAESQAVFSTQEEGFTLEALKTATSLVVVFENPIAGGMSLIWQALPGWEGWHQTDILEDTGAGKTGITTVSEDKKTLTITLSTAIKDYATMPGDGKDGVQLVLAYYSGTNKMTGLGVEKAYLMP